MSLIERRALLGSGIGLALVACGGRRANDAHDAHDAHDANDEKHGEREGEEEEEEEVSPAEDLMREHGVLNRLLLVYEEAARRVESAGGAPSAEAITGASAIVKRFVEDYHERLEEDFLFPRFEKAGKLVDLVATLRRQHQAGRRVTSDIQRLAGASDAESKKQLVSAMRAFVRMYRPHEAREDTVLFPALPSVIAKKELEALGERFEEKEHALFGKAGFEGIVEEVAKIERALGIHDLAQFTP